MLTDNILQEKNKEVLQLRIAGLYLLVKRGSDLEKLTAQSQGIVAGTPSPIKECESMWNILVKCSELYFSLFTCHSDFLQNQL